MSQIVKILIVILLLTVTKSNGQTIVCDTVYSYLEVMPKYENEMEGLSDYLMEELVPIIGDCIKRDGEIIASLYIMLTIDSNGRVNEVTFSSNILTALCKEELKAKLLTMTGWTAGQQDDQKVCCRFNWPISCLKWD